MNRKIGMVGFIILLPTLTFAQTNPTVDQNYCNSGTINAPISGFVTGLCNAGNSVIAELQSYTTSGFTNIIVPSSNILGRFSLSGNKATSTETPPVQASPPPPAQPQTAPTPQTMPSNHQASNPYNYS